jgi:hypothetical protein
VDEFGTDEAKNTSRRHKKAAVMRRHFAKDVAETASEVKEKVTLATTIDPFHLKAAANPQLNKRQATENGGSTKRTSTGETARATDCGPWHYCFPHDSQLRRYCYNLVCFNGSSLCQALCCRVETTPTAEDVSQEDWTAEPVHEQPVLAEHSWTEKRFQACKEFAERPS